MKMNRTLAYGMACLQRLAEVYADGRWADVREIAKKESLPVAYCNKVLAALRKAGMVESARGKGYRLKKPLETISAWELMEAFTFNGVPKTPPGQTPLLLYQSLKRQVDHWLTGLTLQDVIASARPAEKGDA